jgi:cytochrome c551
MCTVPDPKFSQYMVEGERLYRMHCSNCHQRDGGGLRRVYPPLAGSDYMQTHFREVICGMKYGLQGEITVKNVKYNQAMPGVLSLTELELAEIATYIYNTWGQDRGIIESQDIRLLLDSCDRPRSRR